VCGIPSPKPNGQTTVPERLPTNPASNGIPAKTGIGWPDTINPNPQVNNSDFLTFILLTGYSRYGYYVTMMMNANLIQYRLIERFASRHGMTGDQAAMIWIPRHAKAFREWFNRHSH
jgi:hypothetical protein